MTMAYDRWNLEPTIKQCHISNRMLNALLLLTQEKGTVKL